MNCYCDELQPGDICVPCKEESDELDRECEFNYAHTGNYYGYPEHNCWVPGCPDCIRYFGKDFKD
jgi:hypothetical protein